MSATDPTPTTSISPAELQEIVRVFADSDMRELRLSVGAVELLVSRNEQVEASGARPAAPPAPAVHQAPAPAALAPAAPAQESAPAQEPAAAPAQSGAPDRAGLAEIRSPALGTFYRRPAPDQPAFVEVGTQVAVGDAVGTIEVMKMFTTVTSDVAGTVTEICVDDAVLVEHGQPLFYVDPAGS
ncbi:acetyl-CoA carboxylase biotin carboxyl carrier protein [Nocardioides sp. LHG3406-4]|uniref:acetyl-CoA carboxylase biotin carboxyl carrier protein n=1 Tax=Nocardioides sp. LHG3406-4 TaxID=2804575 RepID=UPI003CEB3E98